MIVICLFSNALAGQDYLRNAPYRGIWQATSNSGEVFYFVLKDGVGYRITMRDEVTFSYLVNGNTFDFSMWDAKSYNSHSSTTLTYFDGNFWRYRDSNCGDTYEAVRIIDPLRTIKNNRLRIGVYAYVNGFGKWKLFDNTGNQANNLNKATYFRIVKEVRNEMPVVAHGLRLSDIWIMGFYGHTYQYIEDYFITGEVQFRGYYHFYYYPNEYSKGTDLDWHLVCHGPCKWFYRNGQLKQEGRYKDGVLYGTLKTYDLNGNLIQTKQGRPLSEYDYYVEDKIIGRR